MDNDDQQVGRILSRREVLALMGVAGAGGAALLAGCSGGSEGAASGQSAPASTAAPLQEPSAAATVSSGSNPSSALPACVVRPELTEGPYFVDEKLNRSDIRPDPTNGSIKEGLPLTLTFNVTRVANNACAPLASASVDVWHCDALGVYSDATDPSFNTKGQKFLRGYQLTDQSGKATFTTIYPGWYRGRAVHIHFKIRVGSYDFTSQLFFDDALSAQVFAGSPYSQKGTGGWLRNSGDSIFRQSQDLLTLSPARAGDGYAATFDIGVQV
jgi:protocatechuate 3,4-dioxygenase beta subunit